MSIKLVTQAENAIELNCKFNGNIDLKAPIKQQTGGAVRYDTPQTLTDDQKSQARTNIGAISEAELVQPDWEQNDETAKDYIKNRICYEEETVTELGNTFEVWQNIVGKDENGYYNTSAPISYRMKGKVYKNFTGNVQETFRCVYNTSSQTSYLLVNAGDTKYATGTLNFPDGVTADDFQFVKVENTVKQIDPKFIPIDDELDENSENLVQNKAITTGLNNFSEFIGDNFVSSTLDQSDIFADEQKQVARNNIGALGKADLDTTLSSTSENAVQNKVVKAAIEEVQSATKQYVDEKVGSASGSGSTIKSIALSTNNISFDTASDYKEALAYLWGDGSTRYVNLSKCIITIDGVMVSYVYVNSPYIYFYVPVSSNFEFDTSRRLTKYCYFCNYTEAIAATSTYHYIKKIEYATNILTSDNYTQYISANGTYTQDTSDSNLYNAKEVYVHIQTSDSRCTCVTIKIPENYVMGEKTNEYYYFPESETSNGYLWYDGSTFYVSGSNNIDYIWYK